MTECPQQTHSSANKQTDVTRSLTASHSGNIEYKCIIMPCSQIYDCRKEKERKSIYTALFTIPFIIPIWQPHQSRKSDKNTQCLHSLKALRHISHSFTCKLYHVCHSFVSIHQMAPPLTWGSRHPVAAYYSSIDPEGMRGWVGLVGWPIADGLPT